MAYAILPHTRNGDASWESTAAGNLATPCFRCIFEEMPPPGQGATCDTVGVLGPVVSIVANFQAAETLKILTGNFENMWPAMLNIDIWSNSFTQLKVARAREKGNCPCCRQWNFEFLDGRISSSATSLCGRDAVQLTHRQNRGGLNFDEIAKRLRTHGKVSSNEFMLRAEISDNDNQYELTLFADGRAIVKGTGEPKVARAVFAKYVGM